ncbi:MAG: 5'/3'-nucleotidase SurE [Acidimicrobiia bacterium]
MRILVTNDDGVYSPGLLALAEGAAGFGDVRIVAPDIEQSSAGHAITHSKPLSYRRVRLGGRHEAYRVNGTPADCVALGIHRWGDVDLVLSGINLGPNLGNAIWHSGTLAAAKQAVLLGVPGIAFSTPVLGDEPDYEALTPPLCEVLELLVSEHRLPLVNVNLPPAPRGVRWTRQAVEHYDGQVIPGQDPMGRPHYWLTVAPIDDPARGTDLWAFEHGYISLTPLRLDLTDHDELARLRAEHGSEDPRPVGSTEQPPQTTSEPDPPPDGTPAP